MPSSGHPGHREPLKGGRWITIENAEGGGYRRLYVKGGRVIAGAGATAKHPKTLGQVVHPGGGGDAKAGAKAGPEAKAKAKVKPVAAKRPASALGQAAPAHGVTKAKVTHHDYSEAEIQNAGKAILGRKVTTADLATLSGATHDAKVNLTVVSDREMTMLVEGPGYRALRTLKRSGDKITLHNENFDVEAAHQGQGIGAEVFGRQVEHAAKLGVAEIHTLAAGGKASNGYYTWPRFGYDAPLTDFHRAGLPAKFRDAQRVSDLMKTEEGRAQWKAHGVSLHATFDLSPGSLSRQVWADYRAEKARL